MINPSRLTAASIVGALNAMLVGCSGSSQTTVDTSQSVPAGLTGASRPVASLVSAPAGRVIPTPYKGKSWIKKGTTGEALLYVSNEGNATVGIYAYTGGRSPALVGTIAGFSYPTAPCSDKQGNVFIPDLNNSNITEYAFGSTKASRVIIDPRGAPASCSVDPATGNLAVANFGAGNVGIYSGTTGSPTTYTVPNEVDPEFVGWDNHSNLFVNGIGTLNFELAELVNGSTGFTALTIAGGAPYYAGGVQWGGTYLLVADQGDQGTPPSSIYQVTVSGTTATIVKTVSLAGTMDVSGPFKRGSVPNATVAAPDYSASAGYVFGFPSGATSSSFSGTNKPFGATLAQKP